MKRRRYAPAGGVRLPLNQNLDQSHHCNHILYMSMSHNHRSDKFHRSSACFLDLHWYHECLLQSKPIATLASIVTTLLLNTARHLHLLQYRQHDLLQPLPPSQRVVRPSWAHLFMAVGNSGNTIHSRIVVFPCYNSRNNEQVSHMSECILI